MYELLVRLQIRFKQSIEGRNYYRRTHLALLRRYIYCRLRSAFFSGLSIGGFFKTLESIRRSSQIKGTLRKHGLVKILDGSFVIFYHLTQVLLKISARFFFDFGAIAGANRFKFQVCEGLVHNTGPFLFASVQDGDFFILMSHQKLGQVLNKLFILKQKVKVLSAKAASKNFENFKMGREGRNFNSEPLKTSGVSYEINWNFKFGLGNFR